MTLAAGSPPQSLREWLLADVPRSRRQARLGSWYSTWLVFCGNPLAVTGLAIIGLLILTALLAPLLGGLRDFNVGFWLLMLRGGHGC